MRLRELRITNFGKLEGKRWLLQDGINLIYGKNESGKSTLHSFIKGMLYGMERGRGRAACRDDYTRYEPWEHSFSYGGILRFESGGKSFFLERSFGKERKKGRLICEEDGEELSLEAGDLEMLLGGMDRAGFENTVSIGQLKAEPDQSLGEALQDYAANYFSGGTQEIQLKKALSYLQEQRKQAERRQRRCEEERRQERERLRQEERYFQRDIERLKNEEDILVAKEADRKTEEDFWTSQKGPDEDGAGFRRLFSAENRRAGREEAPAAETGRREKRGSLPGIIGILLLLGSCLLAHLFLKGAVRTVAEVVSLVAVGALLWVETRSLRKREKPSLQGERKQEASAGSYLEQLNWKRKRIAEEKREKEISCENLREQLEELESVSQEWKKWEEERQELLLAEQLLKQTAENMEKQVQKRVGDAVAETLSYLTGKTGVRLTLGEKGIRIWMEEKLQEIGSLSRGTAEQVYFALRMAADTMLYEEDNPILLDDTFVYYDEERLERTLLWLQKSGRQVLLFTCQNREELLLKKLGIPFFRQEL
ncbi:AAA family ATPase [Clostridiaceae bacterium 68-1-5]|uniref:AAA family ATPase n=1 Tax=Suipraeoptans intestinalis TaxID=2606628 RepID=A0A6N7V0V0_9FIRM|nr:AAA family ATPase [Suipraeoptans intestinalis]MSR93777.1 AAA family ATPase [Suipraeoptans intestinalis]